MAILRSLTLALCLVLLASSPTHARRHEHRAEPGGFDYYLLSLSLAPSFCALSPANDTKRECQDLTEAAFEQTPLTVHGLWPNRARVSVNRQPHDCGDAPFDVSDPVQAQLRRYMPAGPGLQRYEWRKHGTCSGLSSDSYFATIARLGQHANDTIGAIMRDQGMLGHTLRINDLLSAIASHDHALAPAIVVSCRYPSGGGEAMVEEIRIILSKQLTPMPAAQAGLGQNSGCPEGAGRIPEVGADTGSPAR